MNTLLDLDIQMFADGKIVISTELDTQSFKKGIDTMQNQAKQGGAGIKNIVAGLGIAKLVGTAFNVIRNSMDDAIKRLDTLNNFPKVMSNLGISADESEKAISKMSEKLAGLPTTLDQGASAVQRFTSKNGDVNKSTDIFLALNNAILAGGASSEIQASALEQLSQAYAKGKPDMMEWRTAMTAMPAQLKQVAEAMGYVDADALGEALRKGEVSMDDFMSKISELNVKGANGFQSFEEQARNSTGGIATSITVAKTQIVKGVTEMIKSVDEGLKKAGFGGLSEVIGAVGKTVGDLIKQMSPYIIKITVMLGDVFKWIKKNEEIIKAIVIPLGAFIATFMTIVKVVSIVKNVAIAIKGLFALFAANPVGLIIAAVAALVLGFIHLWKTSEEFRNFWIGLWEGIKSVVGGVVDGIVTFFTETIPNAIQSVIDFLTGIIDFVKENWQALLLLLVNPFAGAFKLLYDNCEGFRNFINNFIQNIISFFQDLPKNIGYIIGLVIGLFVKWVQRLIEFYTVDVPNFIAGVIDWFKQLPGKIWEFILKVIDKLKEWGKALINFATVEIPRFIDKIVNFFKELPNKIWTWLVNVVTKLAQWIVNMKNKASQGIKEVADKIINGFKELPGKMINTGKNIVEGIWKGIKGTGKWIKEKVGEFAKGILDGMKDALGIKSPSTVFRDEVGKYIAQGVGVGFEKELDNVYKDMQDAIDVETGKLTSQVQTNGTYQVAMKGEPTFNLRDNTTNQTQLVVNGRVLAEVVNTENKNREVAKA